MIIGGEERERWKKQQQQQQHKNDRVITNNTSDLMVLFSNSFILLCFLSHLPAFVLFRHCCSICVCCWMCVLLLLPFFFCVCYFVMSLVFALCGQRLGPNRTALVLYKVLSAFYKMIFLLVFACYSCAAHAILSFKFTNHQITENSVLDIVD